MSDVSERDVEIARAALEAFNTRDLEKLRELIDEQGEFRSAVTGGVEGAVYRGHEGMERYIADLDEVFEDRRTEEERFVDVGDGRVVLIYRTTTRGRGSGVPLDQILGLVLTLRNGRILRGEIHADPHDALKAAGVGGDDAG